MTSELPLSSGSYGQFSDIIRAKERELQQIQDMRNAQLELMIVERDKLLVEASKRYDQLKEDFEYNLSLIEARDIEIERLEKNLLHHERDKQSFEQQIRSLSARLEMLQQKELERIQKMENDKINNKVRLFFSLCFLYIYSILIAQFQLYEIENFGGVANCH
jgi:chromosome segregation ATPase